VSPCQQVLRYQVLVPCQDLAPGTAGSHNSRRVIVRNLTPGTMVCSVPHCVAGTGA